MRTVSLQSIIPQERDPEPEGKYVDNRFRPSFVDQGYLQALCCNMAVPWKDAGHKAFPAGYLMDVKVMISRHVRHIISLDISDKGVVTFMTEDRWSTFAYSFELNSNWF